MSIFKKGHLRDTFGVSAPPPNDEYNKLLDEILKTQADAQAEKIAHATDSAILHSIPQVTPAKLSSGSGHGLGSYTVGRVEVTSAVRPLTATDKMQRVAQSLTMHSKNPVTKLVHHYDYEVQAYQWSVLFKNGTRVSLTSDEALSLVELDGGLDNNVYGTERERMEQDPLRFAAAAKLLLTSQML